MPTNDEVLNQVRQNYVSINDRFDDQIAACGDDVDAKRHVGDNLNEALRNYINAQNRILGANQSKVKALSDSAVDAQKDIDEALKDLARIKDVLSKITTAVKTVGIVVGGL